MKKHILLTAIFLCSIFMVACGAKGMSNGSIKEETEKGEKKESTWKGEVPEEGWAALAERTEYYDLTLKQEEIFDLGLWEKNDHEKTAFAATVSGSTVYLPLGTQFYQGEPVQIWAEVTSKGSDVYLYRKDGSGELLMEGVSNSYTSADAKCQWYIDREGNFYCLFENYPQVNGEYKRQGNYVKILSSEEILPVNQMEVSITIEDFCQTEDGRIYLLLKDNEANKKYLEEVDTATGMRIPESRVEVPRSFNVYLGDGGNLPALIVDSMGNTGSGIVKINPADANLDIVMSFAGTFYELRYDMKLQDCQVLEDGNVELVWTERNGTGGLYENLKIEKVEKDIIVLRGVLGHDTWLAKKVNQFNSESSAYHVILEDFTDSNDSDREDFFRLTNIQIASGKGPDILCGNSLPSGYINGMLEKGALEELTSYMEASGIREEDFFPLTFATWRQEEKIYSVNYRMSLWGEMIDEEILGSSEIPDIETLVDGLLAMERDGVYYKGWNSEDVLKSFLQGTDSLWGMVDWENSSCDFNTPLFGKLLEAAKRHGDDDRKNPESTIMHTRYLDCLMDYNRKSEGMVTCGVLFDDGCYAASITANTLAINANSPHKEGAWDFIRFLISEETQSADLEHHETPVNKKAYETWSKWSIYELTELKLENGVKNYPTYYGADVSDENHAKFLQELESARSLPLRTEPIIEIILDEAKDYFNGYKNAEEISRVINSRVWTYLNE